MNEDLHGARCVDIHRKSGIHACSSQTSRHVCCPVPVRRTRSRKRYIWCVNICRAGFCIHTLAARIGDPFILCETKCMHVHDMCDDVAITVKVTFAVAVNWSTQQRRQHGHSHGLGVFVEAAKNKCGGLRLQGHAHLPRLWPPS